MLKIGNKNEDGIEMAKKITLSMQWQEIKKQHKESVIFFQVGKFYELLDFDAFLAKNILGFIITPRGCGNGQYLPMVGVPVEFSLEAINKFNDAGCRVVIVKQFDEEINGLRKREVEKVYETHGSSENIRKYEKRYAGFKEGEFAQILSKKEAKMKQSKVDNKNEVLEKNFVTKIRNLNLEYMNSYEALKLLHDWKKEILKNDD